MSSYADMIERKRPRVHDLGHTVEPGEVHESLFEFQRDLVLWSLRKGRAAIFADTGLGKTRMQIEWARLSGAERVLMLAPLAVVEQTIAEARRIGVDIVHARNQSDTEGVRLSITNYDRLDHFDLLTFDGVVLDESSILKAFSGTIKKALVTGWRHARWRLACTATPAPNDIEELCNHADFLGVMSPQEMRSTFFIADSRGEFMRYRIKGHAQGAFYRWLSSWAAAVRRPSDLGYSDDEFDLPPLNVDARFVSVEWAPVGQLFPTGLDIKEAGIVRRETIAERSTTALDLICAKPDDPWLIWCGLNEESTRMAQLLRDKFGPEVVAEVVGSDDADVKAERLAGFADGRYQFLVTKASIAGFGMNFQRCADMVFVGLGYSFESYYQALRRCWRFGQTRPVNAWLVLAEPEADILAAVRDKESQHQKLTGGLIAGMVEHTAAEIFGGTSRGDDYEPSLPATRPAFL